eukprot:1160428-Pelagomonas_calceolata.AAC.17
MSCTGSGKLGMDKPGRGNKPQMLQRSRHQACIAAQRNPFMGGLRPGQGQFKNVAYIQSVYKRYFEHSHARAAFAHANVWIGVRKVSRS